MRECFFYSLFPFPSFFSFIIFDYVRQHSSTCTPNGKKEWRDWGEWLNVASSCIRKVPKLSFYSGRPFPTGIPLCQILLLSGFQIGWALDRFHASWPKLQQIKFGIGRGIAVRGIQIWANFAGSGRELPVLLFLRSASPWLLSIHPSGGLCFSKQQSMTEINKITSIIKLFIKTTTSSSKCTFDIFKWQISHILNIFLKLKFSNLLYWSVAIKIIQTYVDNNNYFLQIYKFT